MNLDVQSPIKLQKKNFLFLRENFNFQNQWIELKNFLTSWQMFENKNILTFHMIIIIVIFEKKKNQLTTVKMEASRFHIIATRPSFTKLHQFQIFHCLRYCCSTLYVATCCRSTRVLGYAARMVLAGIAICATTRKNETRTNERTVVSRRKRERKPFVPLTQRSRAC